MSLERAYEKFLGITTTFYPYTSLTDENCYIYEPTSYEGLLALFDVLSLTPYDHLVDFGCGLGRVLFYCNQRFFCYVTGIESNPEIYEALLDNEAYYHVRFHGQQDKFNLLCQEAQTYHITPEDNVFYFFNPFSPAYFQQILTNIETSLTENKRDITLILYYPLTEYLMTLREYGYCLLHLIKLPDYDLDYNEKVYVFQKKPI